MTVEHVEMLLNVLILDGEIERVRQDIFTTLALVLTSRDRYQASVPLCGNLSTN